MSQNNTFKTNKIELEEEQIEILKANKRVNGISIGWSMRKAIEEYIDNHNLKQFINHE